MDNSILQYILTLVGVIISAGISLIINHSSKNQRDSDASQKITDAAIKLVDPMQDQIDVALGEVKKLKASVCKLRTYVKSLRRGVDLLIKQLEDNQIEPLWRPEDIEEDILE